MTENHALGLAWADLQRIPAEDRLYVRYVWVQGAGEEDAQATALVPNYVSQSPSVTPPERLHVGAVMLCRLDLRHYAPRDRDLKNLIRTWEEFQFDPRFSMLLTRDTLKFAVALGVETKRTRERVVDVEPYTAADGKTYTQKRETYEVDLTKDQFDVLRVIPPYLDKSLMAKLIDATQSQAPVVSHRYFLTRALTTIKGVGVSKVIYGGLYYELTGIGTNFKKGTDLDNYLERLGIGNVDAGIVADVVFDKIRSDNRTAQFRSGVTGKPRRVDFIPTLSNVGEIGLVSVTHDPGDEDVDIGTHPIMNLLNVKAKALEVIAVKPNGLHEFPIFNGDGKRQDEVPPNVAHDRTIPAPYTMRLQPAISCIRCHVSGSGWQPIRNDVREMFGGKADVLAEFGGKLMPFDDFDRIRGLYLGDPEFKTLPRARDDYAAAILRATGPWAASKQNQADLVTLATKRLETIYGDYNFRTVNARSALTELGIEAPASGDAKKDDAESIRMLAKLLPPRPGPVDPRTYALLRGLSIPRPDFDLDYAFIATQAHATHAKQGVTK